MNADPSLSTTRVAGAVADIAAGRSVIVVDDTSRENEGDLIFAAELATPDLVAFMVRYTSGYICVSMPGDDADHLDLPPMSRTNEDRRGTAYAVAVSARAGVTNGVSAADRARTIRLLADPRAAPSDFVRPGRVVPLRAWPGGVLRRPGHTEAAADLARLAGLRPMAALCEVVSEVDPSAMARRSELEAFAAQHDISIITIADLMAYRLRQDLLVRRTQVSSMPFRGERLRSIGFRSALDDAEHLALLHGDVAGGRDVPAYVHSACRLSEFVRSATCSCIERLERALETIVCAGRGVVVYLDDGAGSLSASLARCHGEARTDADAWIAGHILRDIGVVTARTIEDDEIFSAVLTQLGHANGAERCRAPKPTHW
jgi:3,4-dihydroxy 2-butanone 4-phosphate synthase/GTP cyclohydrolase II